MCYNSLTQIHLRKQQGPSTYKRVLHYPGSLSQGKMCILISGEGHACQENVSIPGASSQRGWCHALLTLSLCFLPRFSCYRLGRVPALINKVMTVSWGVEGETTCCAGVEGPPEQHSTIKSCHDPELMKPPCDLNSRPWGRSTTLRTLYPLHRSRAQNEDLCLEIAEILPVVAWICPHVNNCLYSHCTSVVWKTFWWTHSLWNQYVSLLSHHPLSHPAVFNKCHEGKWQMKRTVLSEVEHATMRVQWLGLLAIELRRDSSVVLIIHDRCHKGSNCRHKCTQNPAHIVRISNNPKWL